MLSEYSSVAWNGQDIAQIALDPSRVFSFFITTASYQLPFSLCCGKPRSSQLSFNGDAHYHGQRRVSLPLPNLLSTKSMEVYIICDLPITQSKFRMDYINAETSHHRFGNDI